jgi:8-oxo-dGTP pyrophosphatase MutT (NUDIX family)
MYNNPKFPPNSIWDQRLSSPNLQLSPVVELHKNDYFSVFDRGSFYTVEPSFIPVVVLPVLNHENFILVRVKRPVIQDSPLEFPSGGVDSNETPEHAALRELREETGIQIYDTNRLKILPPLSSSPNRNPFLIYCYSVDITTQEWEFRKEFDQEIECVEKFSKNEIIQKIISGEMYITLHIALISNFILTQLNQKDT